MNRFYPTICSSIGGLLLLVGSGVQAYAVNSCLTEVLPEDTKVSVVFTDRTLDYQMKKGEELAGIPKESVNDEGTALTKDIETTLSSTRPDRSHNLTKSLEVQAQNGQRFRLPENTYFRYTLP